jgi:hypothetical protein
MLNALLCAVGGFGITFGTAAVIWSFLYTRKKYREKMQAQDKFNDLR